ncbi:MAG: DUF2188 domain-containing protein [Longimicrobiales bacterium]|nr:DUF2188 domain-containing protein [Longimicrobiales bacterium]
MAAKPVSKKIEKQVKKGAEAVGKKAKAAEKKAKKSAKQVEKRVKKTLGKKNGPSKAKVAGVAAAGVAGLAGIAAAVAYLRRDKEGRATLHVLARDSEWLVTADGREEPLERFSTKEEAVDAARDAAQQAAPSELVIHRLDGSIMRTHSYEPA